MPVFGASHAARRAENAFPHPVSRRSLRSQSLNSPLPGGPVSPRASQKSSMPPCGPHATTCAGRSTQARAPILPCASCARCWRCSTLQALSLIFARVVDTLQHVSPHACSASWMSTCSTCMHALSRHVCLQGDSQTSDSSVPLAPPPAEAPGLSAARESLEP
jgi:hypothetical protein